MLKTNRYLVIASTIGIVAVLCLMLLYRQLALSALVDHQTRANVALTEMFSNSIWSRYRYLVAADKSGVPVRNATHPEIRQLDADVKRLMRGSQVVKVKVYDLSGLTLYSSEASQIGEDKSGNDGFLSARAGQAASNMTYRDRFDAFEGTLSDRDLVSSYIPIRNRASRAPEAVFEVYSDVTGMMRQMQHVQWQIVIGVLGSVALLYGLLLGIARRADRLESERRQEAARSEAQIRYQTYYDPITQLPNRANFLGHLEGQIKRAGDEGSRMGVLLLNVDRFKLVNDSLGHEAGDELLRLISARLRYCVGKRDALFHIGGDEFMILSECLDYPQGLVHLAQHIVDAMKAPFRVSTRSIVVTISIGICVFPDDDGVSAKLIKNADAAMNLAKEAGRNQFRFYTPELNAHAEDRLALESALQQALSHKEFVVHYQPRLAADQSSVLGFEALLRWRRDNQQLVAPGEFISLLEQTGLICEVGQWVINEACLQGKAWQAAGHDPVRISVNVASRQFREPDFVASVEQALACSGLSARYLELELTESALLDNPAEAIATMTALKALGIVLSLDDFGTGYSSFAYLKLLPIDYLKIDRSFVSDLDENCKDAAIIAAIAGVADSLGIGLVAEGVEKPSQASRLIAAGCHELQGFLYSKPVPAAQAERWLSGTAKRYRMAVG